MAVQDPVKWFRRQSAPVAVTLSILLVLGAVLGTFAPAFSHDFLTMGENFPAKFWTILTYPFVGFISIFLVFAVLWIYWVGSMLESDLGSRKFAIVWLLASVVGVLPLVLLREGTFGMLIPGAILVTIWATRNPNMTILVMMIVPVAAKWIGLLAVIGVFVTYSGGSAHPFIGLAAISGCVVGWLFAKNMLPGVAYGKATVSRPTNKPTRAQKAREQEYYDDVYRREKEREEKERLRKLFEDSLEDKK